MSFSRMLDVGFPSTIAFGHEHRYQRAGNHERASDTIKALV